MRINMQNTKINRQSKERFLLFKSICQTIYSPIHPKMTIVREDKLLWHFFEKCQVFNNRKNIYEDKRNFISFAFLIVKLICKIYK